MYTTDVVTKILKEEGQHLFDARSAQLGHTLQGLVPSPLDRTRAARLSLLSMQFLEKHARPNSQAGRRMAPARTETAAMIAIRGSKIVFASMPDVLAQTDMSKRRGEDVWWHDVKRLVEIMGGRAGLVHNVMDLKRKPSRPQRGRWGSYAIAGVNDDCPVPNQNPT